MFRALRLHDPTLFFLALLATGLGILFIFDAGYARSLKDGYGPIPREFISQVIYLPVALIAGALVARIHPDAWKRWSRLLWLIAFVALLLPMVPGLGVTMNGATRWISLGTYPLIGRIMIQPAEFAKIAVIIYLAGAFAGRASWPDKIKKQKDLARWLDHVAIPKLMRCLPALWVLIAVYLIEKEPDLGTAAVVAAIAFAMFYLGGISKKSLVWLSVIGVIGVVFLVKQEPYRLERIMNHSNRWAAENVDDIGWQTVQSEMAMASGGLGGTGIGSGRAKHVLPAATTDFMPATIGEEFGLIGMLIALGLLAAIAIRLFVLARTAPTPYGALVLSGVGAWLTIQTCVNVMMSNAFLPAIGIPLPFYSSGGSSLVALWIAMGLCQSALAPATAKEDHAADRYRWGNRGTRLSRA